MFKCIHLFLILFFVYSAVELLLDRGANIGAVTLSGATPLFDAIQIDNINVGHVNIGHRILRQTTLL